MKVSIIIPVLNESAVIEQQLHYLSSIFDNDCEIIIADGGSRDNTLMLAEPLVDKLVESKKGRAEQMNCGAAVATGDLLLFLHSDTQLPSNTLELLCSKNLNEWGFFHVKLSGNIWKFRIIEFMINQRSRYTRIGTGDQCIFVKRSLFEKNNGYADIPLMEDVELSKRLRAQITPSIINTAVVTSSRRWESNGICKTILLMWRLRLLYFLGFSPNTLVKYYYS